MPDLILKYKAITCLRFFKTVHSLSILWVLNISLFIYWPDYRKEDTTTEKIILQIAITRGNKKVTKLYIDFII